MSGKALRGFRQDAVNRVPVLATPGSVLKQKQTPQLCGGLKVVTGLGFDSLGRSQRTDIVIFPHKVVNQATERLVLSC